MLTREQLLGLWVSVPTEWDEDGNFDEKTFRTEVAMLIKTGVHGLYTTGSTGEYYALDWEEWKQVQDAFLAETVGRIPVQVGANWFNTRDTIKRMRYARDKGADAVQICFPGWMEMRQEDYDQFLVDCCAAVPDIAVIHYNIARTKKLFFAEDYLRVLPKAPTIIGSKAAIPFNQYVELITLVPEIEHFVGELVFPLAHQLGCRGMYTSWTMMNPVFLKEYYQMCVDGRYAKAICVMKRLAKWCNAAVMPLIKKGYYDPTLDKAFVEISGWLPGNRRTRKPHHPLKDDEVAELRRVTAAIIPEFLEYRP